MGDVLEQLDLSFQISPDALHRIELRGVRRQVFERDVAVLLLDVLIHQARSVRLQTIPYMVGIQ